MSTTPPKHQRSICVEDWCMVPRDHYELAFVKSEEPGCEANIGRAVAVVGEESEGRDRHWWVPVVPLGPQPWTLLDADGRPIQTRPQQVWMTCGQLLASQLFIHQSVVTADMPPQNGPLIWDVELMLAIDEDRVNETGWFRPAVDADDVQGIEEDSEAESEEEAEQESFRRKGIGHGRTRRLRSACPNKPHGRSGS